MEFYTSIDLDNTEWLWVGFCAFCIGMSKTGLGGAGMLVVPIMASVFGAKESTGIVLLLLVMADFFGVAFYHRHAELHQLVKLIPSTIAGVLLGIWIGDNVDEQQFRFILGGVIIVGVLVTLINLTKKDLIPRNIYFSSMAGLMGGFTTMIGNAAGPIMSIYFLSMGFDKNKFIGTVAWFFMLVNLFKIPFHILVWKTISFDTLLFDVALFPLILLGALFGVWVVRKIPEKPYRIFILVSVSAAALKLLF